MAHPEKRPEDILRDEMKAALFDPSRGRWEDDADGWRMRRVTLSIPFAAPEGQAETQQAIDDAVQVRVNMMKQLLGSWATIEAKDFSVIHTAPRYEQGKPLRVDVTVRLSEQAYQEKIASREARGALYKQPRPRTQLILPEQKRLLLDATTAAVLFEHLGDWREEGDMRVRMLRVADCSKREDSARAKVYALLRAVGIEPAQVNLARADAEQKEAPRDMLRVAVPADVFAQHTMQMKEVLQTLQRGAEVRAR